MCQIQSMAVKGPKYWTFWFTRLLSSQLTRHYAPKSKINKNNFYLFLSWEQCVWLLSWLLRSEPKTSIFGAYDCLDSIFWQLNSVYIIQKIQMVWKFLILYMKIFRMKYLGYMFAYFFHEMLENISCCICNMFRFRKWFF